MDEDKQKLLEEQMHDKAGMLYEKYREQIDPITDKGIFRVKPFTPYDMYALGTMLEQYENYEKFVEATYGSVADLGTLPKIALDVITLAYAASILPLVASTQPIDEEKGIIYFKKVIAGTARGGVGIGDVLWSPDQSSGALGGTARPVHPTAYAGELVENTLITTTVAGQTDYSILAGVLTGIPVRGQTVVITCPDLGLTAYDDGGANTASRLTGNINSSGRIGNCTR